MKNKKGFTLIEFIVTIAILGILVLLASPRFFGHTQNAERTKGFANARTIEKASELYYMDNNDWPRLTDEPYTSEEIESYSERIFDRTGQEVNLDPEGNYYDIDYDKLSDYVQVPDDKKNYILQNPVGKVFYMENLNEAGIARVNYSNIKEENNNPTPIGGLTNPVVSRDPIAGEEIAIDSADKLAKIGKDYPLDGKYILTSDIDLSGINWTPIGNNNSRFEGSFNGNGYNITGLIINRSSNYVGLFGYAQGATIENVALEDINVNGKSNTGGLVGYANGSTISNSYATGVATGTYYVGGLVGYAYNSSTITNSYATGSVTGAGNNTGGLVGLVSSSSVITNSYATGEVTGTGDDTGGLVGRANSSTTITNSYTTGTVTSTGTNTGGLVGLVSSSSVITNSYATGSVMGKGNYTGGLVGRAHNSSTITKSYATGSVIGTGNYTGGLVGGANNSTITNSYATGSVMGKDYTGGLVGWVTNSTIENSHATGLVKGTINVGGLVGVVGSSTKITNSYWDKETTSQIKSAGGTGKSTKEMKMSTTYKGWDFDTIWQIDEGVSYPTLR